MPVPIIAAAAIGAIANGAFNAITTNRQLNALADSYKQAAKQVREATEKYSGVNAYKAMTNTGDMYGRIYNQRALNSQLNNAPGNNSSAMANAAALQGDFTGGYNQGQTNANTDLNSQYNAATNKAQQYLGQANVNYKVGQAQTQAALQGVQDLAKVGAQAYSSYKNPQTTQISTPTREPASDSRLKSPVKEGINNNSGLPEADIEDSLRQLETVQYKYKDPTIPGCDDEEHVGFTAQSLEKTPLGKDCVQEGDDGIKRVDQWKLREALMAGMAQLQREIDEVENEQQSH